MTQEEREQLKAELLAELYAQRKEPIKSVASEAIHKYDKRIEALAVKKPTDIQTALYTLLRCSYGVRHINQIPHKERDNVFALVSTILSIVENVRFAKEE